MASQALPPAQPAFILRGHSAQIHALHFTPGNARLLTADADGWVVSWNLSYKRPVAVWKAHNSAILGLGSWGPDRIITHGRDNRLLVWQLATEDESNMDKILPVDAVSLTQKLPWLLYAMPVNALNFCSFAMCYDCMPAPLSATKAIKHTSSIKPILFAVPNAIDSGGIDIFELPSRKRAATITSDRNINTGMVMALGILADTTRIQVIAGFESGHTMVFMQADPSAAFEKLYATKAHSQPVLSIAIPPCKDHYLTSAADANIVKHPLPAERSIFKTDFKPIKVLATKHSGQQGLSCRSDGRIIATAGWDSAIRIFSGKTLKEIAVLKWHKQGCYTTAFAAIDTQKPKSTDDPDSDGFENQVSKDVLASSTAMKDVQQERDEKAYSTHWLAAGSKDGKVSLWDIY